MYYISLTTHSKFINNKVTSTNAGVGGALSVPQNTGYINITNTLFDGNVAPLYGGAVYIPTGVNIHDFFNDTFTNNKHKHNINIIFFIFFYLYSFFFSIITYF